MIPTAGCPSPCLPQESRHPVIISVVERMTVVGILSVLIPTPCKKPAPSRAGDRAQPYVSRWLARKLFLNFLVDYLLTGH